MSTGECGWAAAFALMAVACGSGSSRGTSPFSGMDGGSVVGRFSGGEVTQEEFLRESRKLPPELKQQFASPYGQREFLRSMIDKRLLFQEAQRRSLDKDGGIRRQVQELEERLSIQALLAEEQRKAGPPSDSELRAYYDAHRTELSEPERLHLGRLLARVPATATKEERSRARTRAEHWLAALKSGKSLDALGIEGEGAERARKGDLGLVGPGDLKDGALEKAAFALRRPSETTGVVACADGYAILTLIERRAARTPPFEEVKGTVEGRIAPTRQRKALDDLLDRLRKGADVKLGLAARP